MRRPAAVYVAGYAGDHGHAYSRTAAMAFIELGTLKLWYAIHGHGPRVVCIPGTANELRQPLNIFARPVIEHCEVLSFAPCGIGQAPAPDAAPTMIGERVADRVREQLLHALVSQQGAKPDDREHGTIRP